MKKLIKFIYIQFSKFWKNAIPEQHRVPITSHFVKMVAFDHLKWRQNEGLDFLWKHHSAFIFTGSWQIISKKNQVLNFFWRIIDLFLLRALTTTIVFLVFVFSWNI